jgi:hypothetical protein
MVMNGGVAPVFETLTDAERAAGVLGYHFFGLPQVASLLERAAGLDEDGREKLDSEYGGYIPTDSTLQAAFERKFQSSPELFAPLSQ